MGKSNNWKKLLKAYLSFDFETDDYIYDHYVENKEDIDSLKKKLSKLIYGEEQVKITYTQEKLSEEVQQITSNMHGLKNCNQLIASGAYKNLEGFSENDSANISNEEDLLKLQGLIELKNKKGDDNK